MCNPVFAAALCAVFPLAPAPADSPAVGPAPKAAPARALPAVRKEPAAAVTSHTGPRELRDDRARQETRSDTEVKGSAGGSAEPTEPTETEAK